MCLCRVSLWKKGWCLYDLEKRVYIVSRNVVFSEGVFPFAENFILDNGSLPNVEATDENFEVLSYP